MKSIDTWYIVSACGSSRSRRPFLGKNLSAAPDKFLIKKWSRHFRVARENRCAVRTDLWPPFADRRLLRQAQWLHAMALSFLAPPKKEKALLL